MKPVTYYVITKDSPAISFNTLEQAVVCFNMLDDIKDYKAIGVSGMSPTGLPSAIDIYFGLDNRYQYSRDFQSISMTKEMSEAVMTARSYIASNL